MDRLRSKKIKVIKEIELDGDFRRSTLATETVYTSAVKRYNGVLFDLLALRPSERVVMDWFADNMDKDNEIRTDKKSRDKLQADHLSALRKRAKKDGATYKELSSLKPLSIDSIRKAISHLTKTGLLIQRVRGVYIVNPKYFFRGKESERIDAIKMTFRIAAESNIKGEVEAEYEQESMF